jgi:hypothetical protein
VAFPEGSLPAIQEPTHVALPATVRTYHLQDLEGHLSGREFYEYDLVFGASPFNLDAIVTAWIEAVLAAGAEFAWFGFEGSFDFNHILTEDVTSQIFAIGTGQRLELALDDDYREGPVWAARLHDVRVRLGL